MKLELPYKIDISVNGMYYNRKKGRYLKPKALNLRARIIQDIRKLNITLRREKIEDEKLLVGIIFEEDWYYKNGEVRKADLDNRLKFVIDSVFSILGLDDKMIFELYARKLQSEEKEETTIIINKMK